ncbi:MAG: hypothetical protein O3A25_18895 [Acidobacteria bacterium]|nr:hypothetical protein [Acidobacteriota bacterium]
MAVNRPDMPVRDPLVTKDGFIERTWQVWFRNVRTDIDSAPLNIATKALTAQAATISTTALPLDLTAGIYRVSYYARITQAATTNSSLTVTLAWTETAVALSQGFTAMTGNTTTTQQNGTVMVVADANTSLTYATVYSSTGATPMQYRLTVVAERVQ